MIDDMELLYEVRERGIGQEEWPHKIAQTGANLG